MRFGPMPTDRRNPTDVAGMLRRLHGPETELLSMKDGTVRYHSPVAVMSGHRTAPDHTTVDAVWNAYRTREAERREKLYR